MRTARLRRGGSNGLDAWPGYVDALSTLLMVIIFVLLVFVLAQAFLSVALSGRDQALHRLNRQVAQLTDMLSLERGKSREEQLSLAGLNQDLTTATASRDDLARQLAAARLDASRAEAERDAITAERDRLAASLQDARAETGSAGARATQLQGQLSDTAARLDEASGRAASLAARYADTRRALDATQAGVVETKRTLDQAQAYGAEMKRQLDDAATKLATQAQALDQARASAADTSRQLDATKASLAQVTGERDAATANLAETHVALEATSAHLAETQTQLQQAETRAEQTGASLQTANAALADSRTAIAARQADLDTARAERDRLADQVHALEALRDTLTKQVKEATDRATSASLAQVATSHQLADEQALTDGARAQVALLSHQLDELRAQMQQISADLDLARKSDHDKDAEIVNLGSKLNAALAAKVEELQRYRSEFFGRLRGVLANRPGVQVVGDRFVFQSEVLFPVGSADLSSAGSEQITALAETLKQIAADIPPDVKWILRVDGHADRQPVGTSGFVSNWELSAQRAVNVVKQLIAAGIPPEHLAATAFAEFQPIDPAETPAAYTKNRRIELRLTDR